MKFCGDYYDIYENKIFVISNASWEILNRTFFNRISKYSGGKEVTMVTEKRISKMKRTFFIDKHSFQKLLHFLMFYTIGKLFFG